jgi:cysteine-rich repeat protein
MLRNPMLRAFAVATALVLTMAAARTAAATTALLVPQGTAFAAIGHSCGGIQEQAFATGFDATSGFPIGDVYVQTRCGGSGRGGGYHTTTYSAWIAATWDFTGTLVDSAVLASAPTDVDPTFSAFDAAGNEVYNQLNVVNGASCSVGNTSYCAYRAYLALAAGFVPAPRVIGISGTSGPATGGTTVTITGTGFTDATAVSFGDTPAASFVVNGDTSITATAPAASAGTVDVTVTTAGGTSAADANDQFTFIAAPTVSGVDPNDGPVDGGTLVTISGTGLTNAIEVDFGESPAGFTVNDDGSLTAMSPAAEAPDAVRITVATIGGTSPRTAAAVFTYTASGPTTSCGDGTVDPGEQCDDGAANGTPGDCCGPTCTFQPEGSACADDGTLCTADVCDGAGSCTHASTPSFACIPPDVTGGASLVLRTLPSGRNETAFAWTKGPAVALADFGDPTAGEQLELCVYEASGPDAWTLATRGAPSIAGGGRWTRSTTRWKFRSTSGAPDGVTGLTLTASTLPLKAKIQVVATHSPTFPTLPLAPGGAVVAELMTSTGTCWGAAFSAPSVDTAKKYEAKSD